MTAHQGSLHVALSEHQEVLQLLRDAARSVRHRDAERAAKLGPGDLRRLLDGESVPLSPQQLYRLCDHVGLDSWLVAQLLGVVPTGLGQIVSQAVEVTELEGIEEYLRKAGILRDIDAIRRRRIDEVKGALETSYVIQTYSATRGKVAALPYHTYLQVRDVRAPHRAIVMEERPHHERALKRLLANCGACVHLESSKELLQKRGLAGELVLIVEAEFDDKAPDDATIDLRPKLRQLAPVVVLGAYYSGAKDVIALLHKSTGFASIDVSRYFAKFSTNLTALRDDCYWPGRAFERLIREVGRFPTVVTVDDAEVVRYVHRPQPKPRWRREAKRQGTAIMLVMDDRLLSYGGYHIARTKAGLGGRDLPTKEESESRTAGLRQTQADLAKIALTYPRHREIQVRLPDTIARREDGSFADEVDLLFDLYQEVAGAVDNSLAGLVGEPARGG